MMDESAPQVQPDPQPDPQTPAIAPETALPAPEDPGVMVDPIPEEEARLNALAAREAALAIRERQFTARENVLALGLPPEILRHVDYSSDAALERSLALAALASSAAPQAGAPPPVPRAERPRPAFATYRDRAALFALDPQGYREAVAAQLPPEPPPAP